MSKPFLSDEEIFSTLENVISTISKYIPLQNDYRQHPCKFPNEEVKEGLQQQGYNPKMSWAFLRVCYWYLRDHKILDVDPSLNCRLLKEITEERKIDLCMVIFSEYETHLQANYERSLIDPDPYPKPGKGPDSSPGFSFRQYSGGK